MSKTYLIQENTLTNIADNVRSLTGVEGEISLDTMNSKLAEAKQSVDNVIGTLEGFGVEIPEGTNIGDLAGIIENSDSFGGTDTSDATATADEIFAGETAYGPDGKVTGTFTIADELTEQNNLISQISTLVATKANPQGGTEDLEAELTTQESLISQLGIILDSKASGGSGGGMEYEIVNLAEETTSIPFTLKRVTSTFGMMTTSGQGGMGVKNVAHYNLSGMSAVYQGSVVSFLRPLSCENGALTSGTNFVAPYVAIFINDPSKEAIYEE